MNWRTLLRILFKALYVVAGILFLAAVILWLLDETTSLNMLGMEPVSVLISSVMSAIAAGIAHLAARRAEAASNGAANITVQDDAEVEGSIVGGNVAGDVNPTNTQTVSGDAQGASQGNRGTIINIQRPGPQPQTASPQFPLYKLPPRNPHFTGRRDLLHKLSAALTVDDVGVITQTQAITGLGGVGKSQLALAYAHAHKAAYDLIWWLPAEPETALAAEMTALGRALHLPVDALADQQQIVQRVCAWLAGTERRWLLLFDNADAIAPRALRPYLPGGGPGHVLITSRNPNWGGLVGAGQVLAVDVFTAVEAVGFLQERLGGGAEEQRRGLVPSAAEGGAEEIKALAEALGYLPLALEHAAAYMETRDCGTADYLRLFREQRQALLARAKPPDAYHATITTTWELAFAHARQTPGAAALLNLCCCLAPDDIPLDLLARLADIELPNPAAEPLATIVADELALGDALAALRRYSLLAAGDGLLSLHRLVQTVARDQMGAERRQQWVETAVALMHKTWPFDKHDMTTWPACADLLPHMTAVADLAAQEAVADSSAAFVNNEIGFYLQQFGDLAGARPYYERALAIREKALGPDHQNEALLQATAQSLNNLGYLLQAQGDLAGARPYYERALAIREKALGPDHPDTGTSLNNLGSLLQAQGDLAGARPYYERALAIREKALGPDHPDTAASANNLGYLLKAQGDLAGARPYYERALAIREKALGPDHPDTASSVNNLGYLLQTQGDLAGARPYYERALAIYEKALGPDHPDTANSVNNLGYLLQAQGDLAGARPYYERALAIDEKALGPDHPDTATSLNNLAWLYHDEGDYESAYELMQRVVKILENTIPHHQNTATAKRSLAIIKAKLSA